MTTSHTRPPTGTVTFLFTDIVGSTELWEQHGDAFLPVLQTHNAIVAEAIARFGGFLIKTEGDAYKVAFSDPVAAAKCAVVTQAALQRYPWPEDVGPLQVRMAVHTGRPFLQARDYFGPPLNRTARILSTAHGGQVLLSEETLTLIGNRAGPDMGFTDLGYHRLRDLDSPVRLFQIDHPALDRHSFPPPDSLNGHAHNLPVQRTSFIGREKEIEQVTALLSAADAPALTLTGPHGIGKTRLALQVGAERIEWFPDGVWLVRLSAACDAESAAYEVARTLGLTVPRGEPAVPFVRQWLADRSCLLILDDCGHVPEAGRFIRELLSDAPSLRCVATSTESVRAEEGAEFEVPEMGLPHPNADPAEVVATEGGRLFLERVKEARPDFELTRDRAAAVSRVLNRFVGTPDVIQKVADLFRTQKVSLRTLDQLGADVGQSAGEVGQALAERGKELLERVREAPALTVLLQSLGGVAADRREWDEAERLCRETLSICRRVGDRQGVAESLRSLGRIAFRRKDYARAEALLAAAHAEFVALDSVEADAVAADLTCVRRAVGEHAAAPVSLEQAIAVALGGAP